MNPAQRVRKLREFEHEPRLEPGEEEKLRTLTKDDWLWRLRIVAALGPAAESAKSSTCSSGSCDGT